MMDTIIQFREKRDKCLEERKNTVSALLNMRERGFHFQSEKNKLEITRINCIVRHLLADATNPSDDETSHSTDFEIGPSSSDLYDMFGKISEKEMSSDEIPFDEAEEETKEDADDEEEFYECKDLHRYKFRTNSIKDIIPLQNLEAFLLSSDTVYLCDFNKDNFDAKPILFKVQQIANIPTSGDVLCVMASRKEIKRISSGNMVTTFVYTTKDGDSFRSVSSGRNQAYAFALQVQYLSGWDDFTLNLFNEFGVTMTKFHLGGNFSYSKWNLMETNDENKCILAHFGNVKLINLQQCKRIKTYTGSVGTDPGSRFNPTGITTDNQNNILLAVQNDNAIHLLDSSLTFQKLLMTAEDGLHCPSSVALDSDGYLWVGCENGQLHIVNYQYLLNTDRQTRNKN